jgi:hypothetical protein
VGTFASTPDTVYVMRSGMVIYKRAVKDIDSISFVNSKLIRKSIVDKLAEDNSYSIFYQGLVATGLVDSLRADKDTSYDFRKYYNIDLTYTQGSGSRDELPKVRQYGFTLLMESDSVLKSNAINNLSDLKTYAATVYNAVYPEDANITDLTNRKNSLNRFIAYHIINKKLSLQKFIDEYDVPNMLKTVDMYEYLEPMCPNTLIEIRKERSTGLTNLINETNGSGSAIRIIKQFDDKTLYTGFYYGIDKMLCFDASVIRYLSSKRLRFDAASLFPELTNNNMRVYDPVKPRSWVYPEGYISRLTFSERTRVAYSNAFSVYLDYQGDEIVLMGSYDFTLTTPPIPAGTYEVRFGYQPTGARGAAEIYVDGVQSGPPVDLRILASDPEIGYVTPGSDSSDPNGFENDKAMHNHGYMKGPASFKDALNKWYGGRIARSSVNSIRRVVGTFTFSTAKNHQISVKSLIDGQFVLDYIEFVPVSAIESEDIY